MSTDMKTKSRPAASPTFASWHRGTIVQLVHDDAGYRAIVRIDAASGTTQFNLEKSLFDAAKRALAAGTVLLFEVVKHDNLVSEIVSLTDALAFQAGAALRPSKSAKSARAS